MEGALNNAKQNENMQGAQLQAMQQQQQQFEAQKQQMEQEANRLRGELAASSQMR
jgi:hypothetical protein